MTNAKSYTTDKVISSAEYSGDGFHFSFVGKEAYEAALKEIETLKSQNAMLRSLNDSALELADTANGQLATATQEYHKTIQQLDAEISQLYSQIAALEKNADLQSYTGEFEVCKVCSTEDDFRSYLPGLECTCEEATVAVSAHDYEITLDNLQKQLERLSAHNAALREVLARELEYLL